ncbi:hypothetical protein A2344_05780 [Candidatus Peregrinibacteria bacterium RIFOXYB12_FULL_41_12]|nr:MAG: hypothetical protein A2244_04775 [Candidatus Peregrinibacteria bacterium RIFOXYA2_FULL_41_18]OGJ49542.1 MAG: hypothetical protein A2344_05780 [Candidatus Peregrinibacteria bacterium RIFOXYB12_FULL_41_12]OGJ52997.1 MAG: hypothetical protein A2448_04705 [Candidatus Peregrinibacteria bacterium RIFOXYC2_FULL_41_22]
MGNSIIRIPSRPIEDNGAKPQSSPHILKLDKSRKTETEKCGDIVSTEQRESETKIIPSESRSPKSVRKIEIIKLAATGTMVVLLLNISQIYFKTMQAKDAVMNSAYAGYEDLMQATPSDMTASGQAFEKAFYQFSMAEETIWYLLDQPEQMTDSNKYVKTASSMLNAGQSVSNAGQLFSEFATEISESGENLFQEDSAGKPSVTEALKEAFSLYLEPARSELAEATTYLDEVDTDVLPEEYREKVEFVRDQMTDLNSFFADISENVPTILQLLGDEYPQKYMILLENNSELRPGGGFIGSFLIVDLNDGYIDAMDFYDIYEWDGAFNEYIAPPVDEIAYLTCCWGLRDANYSPDYAVSSQAVMDFFEREGGPTVDHVMMVDLSLMSDLIDAIGPITMPGTEAELTGGNFELILSYMVESKLAGETSPKSVVEDLIPVVKEKITDSGNLIKTLGVLLDAAKSEHIAAYSWDDDFQQFWRSMNLDGEAYIPSADEDYLMVTVSGIGGNKTDKYVEQEINHKTLISEDGGLLDKLTITREHTYGEAVKTWQEETLASFGYTEISDSVRSILGSGDNVAGIRVYVPNGTQLSGSTGVFEQEPKLMHDNDLNMDYFYMVVRTRPGETSKIELTYKLPFALTIDPVDDYFLYVEKQPGLDNTVFTKEIIAPNLNNNALYPEGEFTEQTDLSYKFESELDRSFHLGGVFSK